MHGTEARAAAPNDRRKLLARGSYDAPHFSHVTLRQASKRFHANDPRATKARLSLRRIGEADAMARRGQAS
jgi:hypothetical protein